MGSKKLKAIVVRGTNRVNVADKARVSALRENGNAPHGATWHGKVWTLWHGRGGDGATVVRRIAHQQLGFGVMPSPKNLHNGWGGERLYDELLRGAEQGTQDKHGRDTCYACVVRCKRVVESEYKQHKLDPAYGGAEYEALAALGSYCGVNDLHALSYANQLCNEYGVDVVSVGATISWAMECFERGILNLEETDGIELRFGNTDALVAMLEKTLNREGFGDILADGSEKAAQRLGKGQEYLLTVKGQELPAHMPQSEAKPCRNLRCESFRRGSSIVRTRPRT
jgi:aldehyde:ferredoxin oxidoreductase